MKSLLVVILLAFMLSLCNLAKKLEEYRNEKNSSSARAEDVVKGRLAELFNLCSQGNKSEAASYMLYQGPDPNRKGRDVLNYSNGGEDQREVDEACNRINGNIANSDGHDFGRLLNQTKANGTSLVLLEVFFRHSARAADGELYSFTLLDNKYMLYEIYRIDDQSNTSSSNTPIEPPPPPPQPNTRSGSAPISGGVLNGKATSLPQPDYPSIAKAAHASGQVTVQVTVDENGDVIAAQAKSGHPLLQQSAVKAARSAKFSPTRLSGQPVKVTGILIYNFVAQ
ncbi:MAG TPA: energy transducer TonB [Pyrinomonadaceae bacterium]|nr:energy transducer TonB [Pyrinomonadaceae bacterium]